MKNEMNKREQTVKKITEFICDIFSKYELAPEAKICPIIQDTIPQNDGVPKQRIYKECISLGSSFDELSTRDKLMIVKATINTYHQCFSGSEAPYYYIIEYQLTLANGHEFFFDINGNLLDDVDFFTCFAGLSAD